MVEKKDDVCPAGDVLKLGPEMADGRRPFIRHGADHSIRAGVASPIQDGASIPQGVDVVALEHLEGDEYKVTPMLEQSSTRKGPAKVSSQAYRSGWEALFGKKNPVGQA